MTLGPAVRDGEHVFGVAHIFASFNDTFIVSVLFIWFCFFFNLRMCMIVMDAFYCLTMQHVTDLSGRETLVRITGIYHALSYNSF